MDSEKAIHMAMENNHLSSKTMKEKVKSKEQVSSSCCWWLTLRKKWCCMTRLMTWQVAKLMDWLDLVVDNQRMDFAVSAVMGCPSLPVALPFLVPCYRLDRKYTKL
jgi:hypothetical protein